MRSYEVAAVKMAVKRAKKNGLEHGFRSIETWRRHWNSQGIAVDYEGVLKWYRKWYKRQLHNQKI